MNENIKTVGDLIIALERYACTTPVCVTWEGIFKGLTTDNIYHSPDQDMVFIDADGNSYKERYVSGKDRPDFDLWSENSK